LSFSVKDLSCSATASLSQLAFLASAPNGTIHMKPVINEDIPDVEIHTPTKVKCKNAQN